MQWSLGKTFGKVDCFLGACAGAKIGADTTGKVGGDYALKVDSGTFDSRYAGRVSITVPTAVSGTPTNIGPVTLGTGFVGLPSVPKGGPGPVTSVLQVHGPTVQGHLGLEVNAHAFAGAELCVVACTGPNFAPPDISKSLPIASINEGNSGVFTVLGQTVNANQNVSALGGLIDATIRLPNLDSSSTATPGGFTNGVLTSVRRDNVAALNANVAQIGANAVGLPIPLSGNLGPFGYNLLQANAGTALDIQQKLSLSPSSSGSLQFSQLITPLVNGVAGPLTRTIDFQAGDNVSFLPGQVATLSIVPTIRLGEQVRNTTDLIVNGNVNVQALGLNIGPLNIGPLVNERALSGDLATIKLFSKTFYDNIGSYTAQPISIDFSCSQLIGSGEIRSTGLCSSTKYVDEGPSTALHFSNGAIRDTYDLVSCSPHYVDQTPYCTTVPSYVGSAYFPDPSGPIFVTGDSTTSFLPIVPGNSTTDAQAIALLASLGYTGPASDFPIPIGETFAQIVPEPGTMAMVLTALMALCINAGLRGRYARNT